MRSRSKLLSTPVYKQDPAFASVNSVTSTGSKSIRFSKYMSLPRCCASSSHVTWEIDRKNMHICLATVRLLPHPRVRLQLNRVEEPLLTRLLLHQTQTPRLELSPQCMRQDGFSCVCRCCFLVIFVLQENRSTERDHGSDPPFDAFHSDWNTAARTSDIQTPVDHGLWWCET